MSFKSACVPAVPAVLLSVSSTMGSAGWKSLPVTALIIEHSVADGSGCRLSQGVTLAWLSSENSFFYHCLLCRSHMVRVKVRLTTAAPLDTLWVLLLLRRETHAHMIAWLVSEPGKVTIFWKRRFSIGRVDHFCNLPFILLSSTLSFAPLCFCVVFTCCMQVTVTHNGDSVASEK